MRQMPRFMKLYKREERCVSGIGFNLFISRITVGSFLYIATSKASVPRPQSSIGRNK